MTSRQPLVRAIAVVLVSALVVAPARAAPSHKAVEAHKAAEARDLYKRAMQHYELGEYDPAIDNFKKAYELSQAPGLLFNLGQVYRLKKDWPQAIRLYRSYLRLSPQAKNKADVEAMLTEMQAALDDDQRKAAEAAAAQQAQAAQTPTTPATTTPTTPVAPAVAPTAQLIAPPPPPPPPKHVKLKLWLGGALVVGGLGAVGAGVALGLRANKDSQKLIDAANQNNQTWDSSRQALYRDGQHMATAATTLYIAGGALVAAGVVVGILGLRDRRHMRQLALLPSSDGAGVLCAF